MASALRALLAAGAGILVSCGSRNPPSADGVPRSRPPSPPQRTAAAAPERGSGHFERGSTAGDVTAAMGSPDEVRTRDGGIEVWSYGFSTVTFRNDRVAGWANHGRNLKARGGGDTATADDERPSEQPSGTASMSPELAASIAAPQGPASGSGATNPSVQYVGPYRRADGSHVGGHLRTRADTSPTNNFSSRGNVNPNTGKRGYR